MSRSRVLLVRHGESRWNAADRVQGWAPVKLTGTGREQAIAAAELLRDGYDVDRIVSSDVRRARTTASILADTLGVTVEEDKRWRERDFGALQGLPSSTLLDRFPEFDLLETDDAASNRPTGGESVLDVQERVREGFAALDADGTVAVVTHFAPILLTVGDVQDRTLTTALTERRVGTGSVTELVRRDGEWTVADVDRRPRSE